MTTNDTYDVDLTGAERRWLLINLPPDVEPGLETLRPTIMSLHLYYKEDEEALFSFRLAELQLVDEVIFGVDPWKDKLSDGKTLFTFTSKIWRHLADVNGPLLFKGGRKEEHADTG